MVNRIRQDPFRARPDREPQRSQALMAVNHGDPELLDWLAGESSARDGAEKLHRTRSCCPGADRQALRFSGGTQAKRIELVCGCALAGCHSARRVVRDADALRQRKPQPEDRRPKLQPVEVHAEAPDQDWKQKDGGHARPRRADDSPHEREIGGQPDAETARSSVDCEQTAKRASTDRLALQALSQMSNDLRDRMAEVLRRARGAGSWSAAMWWCGAPRLALARAPMPSRKSTRAGTRR